MNKIFLTILITTLIASTVYFAVKPVKIKEIRFYDSSLTIANQDIKEEAPESKIVPQKRLAKVQPVKPAPKVQPKPKMTPKPTSKAKAIPKPTPKPKVVKKTPAKKPVTKKIASAPKPIAVKPPVKTPKVLPQKPVQKTVVKKTKPIEKPKVENKTPIKTKAPIKTKPPVKTTVQPKPVKKSQPAKKVLSEREETIVWNQWRANVENEILRLANFRKNTSNSYPDKGTDVYFNFDVDIYGNISNISIRAVPASQLNNAKNYYIPLIMMMNRKPVLKFPEGTKRTNVTVSDGVRIMTSHKDPTYADSTNYADYEKVKIRF